MITWNLIQLLCTTIHEHIQIETSVEICFILEKSYKLFRLDIISHIAP